jgi:type VI secretion system protein VasJ
MAVDVADLTDLAALGKTPISPEAPAGADVSYDPEYESLQREIDKLSMVTADGTTTDWNLVAHLAAGILGHKAKDLKVAAYLAEALARTGRLDDLAVGVHILRDLVETYWDGLYPPKKRLRGRLNALDWWQERAKAALAGFGPEPLPAQTIEALTADLTALDQTLAEKAEDATPLAPLIEAVSRLPVQEPEPAPETAPRPAAPGLAGAAPGPASQSASAPAAPSAPPVTPPAAPAAAAAEAAKGQVEAGLDLLFGACDALWHVDPASPVPYRLARLAAWLPLAGPPPAQGGKTLLPAPPAQVRNALDQTLASGNFLAAIASAESRVREFRFWLDLSRLTAEGLRSLGPAYAGALDALETETALFVRRFPGLANLAFADGTPLADEKTRFWLSRLGRAPANDAAGQDGPAAASDGDTVEAVLAKARDLAANNQAVAAASLLQASLGSARSGRMRLRWRIGLAEILLGAGHPESARPLIDQMLADLDAHALDAFDPDLAVAALATAHQGLASGPDEASTAKAREVLARIMRLDPARGLRLSGIQ